MGLGYLGPREVAVMLFVLAAIVGVPVALVVCVARWIARRAAEQRELVARVARLEASEGAGPDRAAPDRAVT